LHFNPILHTAWLDNLALTLKSNTSKYYFDEKSSFTFLKFCYETGKSMLCEKQFSFNAISVLKMFNL